MNAIPLDEEAIYHVARRIGEPEARQAYLGQVCGDDAALSNRVEALLRVCDQEPSFLEVGPFDATIDVPAAVERPGTIVGPYTLMEPIGEGGMGVVYRTEQTHPVRREVALKIIKPGMDTKQVVARFEAERQALALMDHPNIARVVDAGSTEFGRPYFVMELVAGVPITAYCDQNHLTIPERLDLFVLVCRAVQHAHQKGIIHRDLKPSNVLVTLQDGVPVPKVIDFGIAKATGPGLTELMTAMTGLAQVVGTPLYMSPEQAELNGHDIDTRSDIYSLGVLLYELLTGTTPFEPEAFRKAALGKICQIVREHEPPRPSTRLSTLADGARSTISANRQTDPRRLGRAVHGELDWIVMKCLEKDRARRYETASGLAGDLMRYLINQPIEACPPSAWYRAKKYVRRNRVALTTTTLVALALVSGTAVSVWQAVRATRAEARADRRTEDTQAVLDYLVDDVLGSAAVEKLKGRAVTVNEMLAASEATIPARFRRRPLVEAATRLAIGRAYYALGQFDKAEQQFRRVVALRTRLLGPDDPGTLAAQVRLVEALAPTYWAPGSGSKPVEAESLLRGVLDVDRRRLGPEHPVTLDVASRLGFILWGAGKFAESRELLEWTFDAQCRVLGPDHIDTLRTLDGLGHVLRDRGSLPAAEAAFRRAIEGERQALGTEHPYLYEAMRHLSGVLYAQGRVAEAIPVLRETVEGFHRIYGPTLPQAGAPTGELMQALRDVRDYTAIRDLSERWLREILAMPVETDPYLRDLRMHRLIGLVRTLVTLPEPNPLDVDLAIRAAAEAGRLSDGKAGCVTLAFLYSRVGRADLAVQAIEKVKARPDWASMADDYCWLVEALIRARRGELTEARRLYDHARNRPNPTAFGQESYQGLQQSVEALIAPKSPPERSKRSTPRPTQRP